MADHVQMSVGKIRGELSIWNSTISGIGIGPYPESELILSSSFNIRVRSCNCF